MAGWGAGLTIDSSAAGKDGAEPYHLPADGVSHGSTARECHLRIRRNALLGDYSGRAAHKAPNQELFH